MTSPQIAVIITCYDLGRTVEEALQSVLDQTLPAAEVLIVDDGSRDLYTQQVLTRLERAGHNVLRTVNRGVSAARNTGIRSTRSPYLVLLDADDMLEATYLEKAAATLEGNQALAFVSCGMTCFGAATATWYPGPPDLIESMVNGVVHVSSMFRREVWEAVGGFDESFHAHEEVDFWTRVLEHGFRGEVLAQPLLRYRIRARSMYQSAIRRERHLDLMERFYRKHQATISANAETLLAAKERFILDQQTHQTSLLERRAAIQAELDGLAREISEVIGELRPMNRNRVDFGDFRQTTPLSPFWGLDRGKPLDRYYIESFLDLHRLDIRGHVLEVKDPGYTQRFGDDRVTASDVLDVDPTNERATIVADLTQAGEMPANRFDCLILTQVLPLIYDVHAAVANACRALKPGGVLLCTAPALGRINYAGRALDGDYWRFTEASLRRLFAETFPIADFEIESYGNVLAGAAFLYGLAPDELTPAELNAKDPFFPVIYGVRAARAASPSSHSVLSGADHRSPMDSAGSRILVAGWFSFEEGHATAGDFLACDVACDWIKQTGRGYDIALAPSLFPGGVDWRTQPPDLYSHVVFVCGPFANSAQFEGRLLQRFHHSRLIGLNLSMLLPLADAQPFDDLFERDSNRETRPDIVFAAPPSSVPVVGVCLVEDSDGADTRRANSMIAALTAEREVAVVAIDTRLDVNATGLRTPREIESLIAHVDVLVTTRLHGIVLALRNGVPALAIDPQPGGGKIRKQADALGWPYVLNVDQLTAVELRRAFDECLMPQARIDARQCAARASERVANLRGEFLAAVERAVKT